jgi:quercetin dioxygenase-like cupin family protein
VRVEKSWGYEQILHNGFYCMKLLVYTKPIASSLHFHEHKTETFYVSSGSFELEVCDYIWGPTEDGGVVSTARKTRKTFVPGSYVHLPAGVHHRLRCMEPGIVVEASTRDDPDDCVRLEPSET